jgi:hypothetical protein
MFVVTEACIILPSACRAWRWGELQHQYRFEAAREAFEFFIVFENGPLMQVSRRHRRKLAPQRSLDMASKRPLADRNGAGNTGGAGD